MKNDFLGAFVSVLIISFAVIGIASSVIWIIDHVRIV